MSSRNDLLLPEELTADNCCMIDMEIEIRDAVEADSPFVAWAVLAALSDTTTGGCAMT